MVISVGVVMRVAYSSVVPKIPGSTAALYSGEFTTAAIMGLVINYAGTLVLSLAVSITQLFAQARSVRSVRNSVWKRMMGIQSSYYNDNEPERLLSAVTSDAENTVSSLITVIVTVPSLLMYLSLYFMMDGEIKKELSGSQPRDVLEEAISQVMFGE